MSDFNKINIDVEIPAYNREHFIIDTIMSVENQTFKPKNIIIIDDGSTDNTEKIIYFPLFQKLPVLRYLFSKCH